MNKSGAAQSSRELAQGSKTATSEGTTIDTFQLSYSAKKYPRGYPRDIEKPKF